jgi:hypothetical protein
MKVKTNELTGAALDWAVAKATGEYKPVAVPKYSTDWSQGGPIIEREKIAILSPMTGEFWDARDGKRLETPFVYWRGPTPLIAAMRCYVASKLGDEVEIPEGLK